MTAGLLLRRSVAAIAVMLAAVAAVQVVVPMLVREQLAEPDRQLARQRHRRQQRPGAGLAAGVRRVPAEAWDRSWRRAADARSSWTLQWRESALLVGVSVLLVGSCSWRIRRDLA